jgi:hypothetical protein
MGAALDLGVPELRGVLPLDTRGIIPPDPRDHMVLETIYNEMHAERWINLAPLSLLANTVGLWFKGESFIIFGRGVGCMCSPSWWDETAYISGI